MTTTCAACGTQTPSQDTYFSDKGEVCGPCNAKQEARDSAAFHDTTGSGGGLVDSGSASSSFSLYINVGPVGIDIAPIFMFIPRLFRRLFASKA